MLGLDIDTKELDFDELNQLPVPDSEVAAYYVIKKLFGEYFADQVIDEIIKVNKFYKEELSFQYFRE